MSTGVFVVNNSGQVGSPTCRTILGYRNLLPNAIASGSGVSGQDPDHPLSMALDHSYNTEYSVSNASSAVIVFSFSSLQPVDYFMLISKNAQESQLSVKVEAYIPEDGDYVELGGFGSISDGVPVMIYFGDEFDPGFAASASIRITLTFTSKPYIMSMMCGKAVVFPRTMSLGFQPGATASMDEVRAFNADEGLNVVTSRRLRRGKQARGSINYVRMKMARQFWPEYMDHVLDSKPVCLMWNDKEPTDVIYGIQNPDRLTKLSYKTNMFTQIDFDIIGWA